MTVAHSTSAPVPPLRVDELNRAATALDASAPAPECLSLDFTLLATAPLGIAIGALAGLVARTKVPGGVLGGSVLGGIAGVVTGTALVGLDRMSGGAIDRLLPDVLQEKANQIRFVLRHPLEPWLGPFVLRAAGDARTVQRSLYGHSDMHDGGLDAFRHAYGAALLVLRLQRDHHVTQQRAAQLMTEAGKAYEADGDDNDTWSHTMDLTNNATGIALAGEGHDATGAWMTEEALRDAVLDAIAGGRLLVVDRPAGASPQLRATTAADLPLASRPH